MGYNADRWFAHDRPFCGIFAQLQFHNQNWVVMPFGWLRRYFSGPWRDASPVISCSDSLVHGTISAYLGSSGKATSNYSQSLATEELQQRFKAFGS